MFGVIERGGRAKTVHMPEVTMKNVVDKIKDTGSIHATAIHTDDSHLFSVPDFGPEVELDGQPF